MRHMGSGLIALAALIACAPAWAENCQDSPFGALAAADCRCAFVGELGGQGAESAYLAGQSGASWVFAGKSDDIGNGPFGSNPQTAIARNCGYWTGSLSTWLCKKGTIPKKATA